MVIARLERPYRVRFDEAGPDGLLRSSGYLRYAQDLAWIHSESEGFGREWYGERGLTWLVRGIELDVIGEVPYGYEVTVSTQIIGFRRMWVRRRSEFHARDLERPLALAITDWVLLNARGVPTRVPAEIADALIDSNTDFTPIRLDDSLPPKDAQTLQLAVRRSELDPMAHVNNAAYLDYLDEQYFADSGPRTPLTTPRRYRAEFIASAEPRTQLVGRLWRVGEACAYRLESASGTEMLRASLETDPASWVGG